MITRVWLSEVDAMTVIEHDEGDGGLAMTDGYDTWDLPTFDPDDWKLIYES